MTFIKALIWSWFTLISVTPALAWGRDGHRIIGDIAERYLEPAAAREVHELLALDNATSLVDVGSWADTYRSAHRETAPWHYVNIPVSEPTYDATRDCPEQSCIVAKIEHFRNVLADKNHAPRTRLDALKFLVHFVGDLHQPLHAADNGDKGGNVVSVTFQGAITNLHVVWDTDIIKANAMDEPDYPAKLGRMITHADVGDWQRGSLVD